ncbi:MAG: hypothetical protein JKY28_01310 [Sulfurimonas sp.]|nr:hypothetical protein [Sulfurimonas sp.]
MFLVTVEKECGCLRKSEIQKEKSFEKREDAVLYSQSIAEIMNEDFCQQHLFTARASAGNEIMITVGQNAGGGCCGGGHCD